MGGTTARQYDGTPSGPGSTWRKRLAVPSRRIPRAAQKAISSAAKGSCDEKCHTSADVGGVARTRGKTGDRPGGARKEKNEVSQQSGSHCGRRILPSKHENTDRERHGDLPSGSGSASDRTSAQPRRRSSGHGAETPGRLGGAPHKDGEPSGCAQQGLAARPAGRGPASRGGAIANSQIRAWQRRIFPTRMVCCTSLAPARPNPRALSIKVQRAEQPLQVSGGPGAMPRRSNWPAQPPQSGWS